MKLSIVIPAFNEEKLLPSTLDAIKQAAQAVKNRGWKVELIVCDNNSTDRTAAIARKARAKVVFEPVNQIARARNTGSGAATGDWLLFIDADSRPTPELFDDLITTIETGKYLGGGSLVKLDEQRFLANCMLHFWSFCSRVRQWAAGSFVFCERAAFQEVGGFSHELFASEEIELCERLKRVARRRGKRLTILTRYPMETSARKFHLYSKREIASFLWRAAISGGRRLKERDGCVPWYDGRR